jgi:hypothetical protein
MKKTHDKVLICNRCFYRLDCNDIRYGDNLCLLYKKDPDIELNDDKKANTEGQYIDDQDTIEMKTDYFRLLHKKMN